MTLDNLKIGDVPDLGAFIPKSTATRATLACLSILSILAGLKIGMGAKSLLLPAFIIASLWLLVRHATRELRNGYLFDQPHQSDNKQAITGKINFPLTKLVKEAGIDTIVTETRSHQYQVFSVANTDPQKVNKLLPAISMTIGVDQKNLKFIQNFQTGKSAVLAPLPQDQWKAVKFDRNQLTQGKLIGYVGQSITGEHITYDRRVEPFLLVAGTTNSGKTEAIRVDIESMRASGLNPKIFIIDPKEDMADVKADYYTAETSDAVTKLEALFAEAEARKSRYSDAGCKNYFEYQSAVDSKERPLMVYIDEAADLLAQDLTEVLEKGEHPLHKRAFSILYQITRKSRAAGLFVTLGIQHPKAETLKTEIRNNFGARLVLSVVDGTASKVAIDQAGAETLPKFGAFLFRTSLSNAPAIGRGAYLS